MEKKEGKPRHGNHCEPLVKSPFFLPPFLYKVYAKKRVTRVTASPNRKKARQTIHLDATEAIVISLLAYSLSLFALRLSPSNCPPASASQRVTTRHPLLQ
jgi:hypothetical protein